MDMEDDADYGAFYDAGSDAPRRKRRQNFQFVSAAGDSTPSKKRKPGPEQRAHGVTDAASCSSSSAADAADGEEDERLDVDVPTHLGRRIAEGARVRRESAAAASRRRQASPVAPVPGSLESKYPAAVARMMAAMRYKPGTGLGKNAQGIVTPLAGVPRPGNAGLGSVVEPKLLFSGKENLPPPPPPPVPAEEEHPRWSKKAGARRQKDPVLTKHALLATRAAVEQEQPMVVEKVIDMRGPQPRVLILTDLTGLNDQHDDDVPVPELQYNLRLLVDDAAAGVARLDSQLRREQADAAGLIRDKERLAQQEASQRHELQTMEAIAAALEQVRLDAAAGALTPAALLDTFRHLKARHGEEFDTCGVAWIAGELARPILISVFHGWQPLRDPSFGLEIMSPWKDLLQPYEHHFLSDGTDDPYVDLVHEVILSIIRSSGTNSWEPRDPEPMLRFLESWETLLPATVLESVLDRVIVPKISAAVESWDPRTEDLPIHVWVHPWLPILGAQRTDTLCNSIRYKLSSSVLRAWQPTDDSAYAVLSPWKGVFDPAMWDDTVARYIVPKLKMALQEFQINPAADYQELKQFSDLVMIWASAVPVHHMVHMLEVDFFSKWHQVLYNWLSSPDPDFGEIIRWYKGWKWVFPPELLANARIRVLLAAGLNMMNQGAEGLEVVQPAGATEDRQSGDAAQRVSRSYRAYRAVVPPGAAAAGMVDLSFKESIQAYAMEQGLLFMPRVGRFYDGVQVYEFGAVSACIDSVKRLLYAQVQEGTERWRAVSLTELMEMNRVARPS